MDINPPHPVKTDKKVMIPCIVIVLALCLAGCSSINKKTKIQPQLVLCNDPRPQICTMIYQPVCGTLEGGSQKTYASDCTACSDTKVIGYQKNECPL
ncbi:MAG: hypothetical protein KUG72_12770 [Pseudomonadales bacterium]|nr:hypothetical protein [Pseudomonadales bacterium]